MCASAKFAAWARQGRRGVAITGASGWIGSAAAYAVLRCATADSDLEVRLFGSTARSIGLAGRRLPLESLDSAPPLDPRREWIVLHFAVAGADRESDPQRLRALNDRFLEAALRLAEPAKVRRFVSASSGAVHLDGGNAERRAYADMKRDHEAAARAWAERTGAPLLLPRIFNVGGPYMNHAANYALGDFILQARRAGAIRIGAARPVIRSYVHVLELAAVTLDQALAEAGEIVFETVGGEIVEMADLAQAVAGALGLDIRVLRPPATGEGQDRYVGDGTAYRAALEAMGAQPIGLDRVIRDTDAWLKRSSSR